MISLCYKCIKRQEFCKTKLSDVEFRGDELPLIITKCKNFEKRIDENHKCSDCKKADWLDCGSSKLFVKIAGRRIFVCEKYEKGE